MESLNESLTLFLNAIKKKNGAGVKTKIEKPNLIHSFDLEKSGLLTKEVILGTPKIKVNYIPSCNYEGCTESHTHIHVKEETRYIDDLKRYHPIMIKDDEGNEVEDIKARPLGLIVESDGLWQPIKRAYKFSIPCPFCGLTNKYLIRFQQSGLTAAAIDKHLGNYDWEEGLEEKALDFVKKKIRGGLIYGHTGNGKTHLLNALAREMIWSGRRVRYVSHQNLLERIKQSFDNQSGVQDPRYTWLDRVDVVFFDELGFFRMNDWGIQTTNELLHALYESKVQVLFASNLTPKQMKSKFLDIRSQSRIAEMCGDFLFEMKGKDRRGDVKGFFK